MVAAIPKPKRPDNRARRFALNMKTTKELRDRLEDRANSTGRSFTLEVEQQLIKSFDLEEQIALQDEVKAEMRGTIAALEDQVAILKHHIDVRQQTDDLLWPDESARILGQGFSMALAAARHASGQDWREDRSASLIVAGAVRRVMDRYTRDGASLMAELFDGARIAATADRIVETVGPYLDKAMPPLSAPEIDVAQWTGRAFLLTEFREAATGAVLEAVAGPEFDAANPEDRPSRGDRYRPALAQFAPIRHRVDAEDFEVFVMRDGSHRRVSLDLTPAAPIAPTRAREPAPLPEGTRWATSDEIAGMVDAPGQLPPSIGDQAIFDEAVSDLPLVKAEKADAAKRRDKASLDVGAGPPEAIAPPAASKRRGRAKTEA